jgi:hypothetical protein
LNTAIAPSCQVWPLQTSRTHGRSCPSLRYRTSAFRHYGARYVVFCLDYCVGLMGLLSVSWTYPAEIFPLRIRAKAVSLSTATNWTFNCILGSSLLFEVVDSILMRPPSVCSPSRALEHLVQNSECEPSPWCVMLSWLMYV